MIVYFPYGLIAIGLSMYIFYTARKKKADVTAQRRGELKDSRQEWLDHKLGKKTSSIILYGEFMNDKIKTLNKIGASESGWDTYYTNKETGEKWIKEYRDSAFDGGGEPQLRKVEFFPYEKQ